MSGILGTSSRQLRGVFAPQRRGPVLAGHLHNLSSLGLHEPALSDKNVTVKFISMMIWGRSFEGAWRGRNLLIVQLTKPGRSVLSAGYSSRHLRRPSSSSSGWQPEIAPDRRRRLGAVQGVEMQTRRSGVQQPLAQVGDELDAELLLRPGVVSVGLHPLLQPQRDLGAASGCEVGDLRVVPERHDAGDDGDIYAHALDLVHEVKIGVSVEEKLGHGRIGARLHLLAKVR